MRIFFWIVFYVCMFISWCWIGPEFLLSGQFEKALFGGVLILSTPFILLALYVIMFAESE